MPTITPTESKDLLSTLQPNYLYILLFWHPNPDIRYHWGLYHHADAESGGWKFDIINPGGIWRLAFPYGDGKSQMGILDSDTREPLGVMVRIGIVNTDKRDKVHEIIRREDDRLNKLNYELEGGISCKVYVKRACERLKEARFIEYRDWIDVEKEVLQTGDKNEDIKGKGAVIVDSLITTINGN